MLATALAVAGVLGSVLDLGAGTLLPATAHGAAILARRSLCACFAHVPRSRPYCSSRRRSSGWRSDGRYAALGDRRAGGLGAVTASLLGLVPLIVPGRLGPRPVQAPRGCASPSGPSFWSCSLTVRARRTFCSRRSSLSTLVALLPLVRHAPGSRTSGRPTIGTGALGVRLRSGFSRWRRWRTTGPARSPLPALSDAHETAVFSVVARIAFGMLMLPNAITTALLPRLSVDGRRPQSIACARRALAWTFVDCGALASAARSSSSSACRSYSARHTTVRAFPLPCCAWVFPSSQ